MICFFPLLTGSSKGGCVRNYSGAYGEGGKGPVGTDERWGTEYRVQGQAQVHEPHGGGRRSEDAYDAK